MKQLSYKEDTLSDKYSIGQEVELGEVLFNIYKVDNKNKDIYWVGGYCKYQTRWREYQYETLDAQSYDNEYGVRPIIVVEPSEIKE